VSEGGTKKWPQPWGRAKAEAYREKCRSETASYSRQNKVVERSMLMTITAFHHMKLYSGGGRSRATSSNAHAMWPGL
jgi:hypothetical protein